MRLGLGIGISMFRGFWTGGPFEPITYPINPALWSASEAVADANTRKVQTIANIPAQDGYEIGEHHSTNPAGNIAQIGLMSWDGSKYTRTSTNPVTRGSNQYNRLARRLVGLGWEWITGPADTKPFTASDVPDAPTGSWAALSSGVVRVTLAPWNGQRRAVTGGEYQIGSGSWVAFSAAASGSNTIVDVPGLTDGVETGVNFRWVNANVDSTHPAGVLSMTVIAQSAAPVPVAPRITYLVDGSGTQATVYFDLEGGTPTDVTGIRYRIGGGSSVVRAGVAPLALTGLAASQSFEAEWTNSTGYSATTSITLQAALPTYEPADWAVANASTEAGDGVNLTYSNHPSAPTDMVRLGTQWSADAGVTWHDFTTSPVATGIPNAANSILSRAIFDVGPSIASAAKTVTPTYPALVTAFPTTGATPVVTTTGNASVSSATTVNLPAHIAGQRLFVVLESDGNPTFTPTESGWNPTRVTNGGAGLADGNLWYFTKIAASSAETLTITPSAGEQFVCHARVIDGSRSMVVGTPVDQAGGGSTATINLANLSFGGATEKALVILALGQWGEYTAPTGAPADSYSGYQVNTTAASSSGVRLATAYKQVEAAGFDPSQWPENMRGVTSVLFAFLPNTSVPPVTSLTVTPSATNIEQGDSVTFTMAADGQRPVTYSLTIDGSTTTNTTGVFTRTPTTGTKPWTASATNAAGATINASGTITVQDRMLFTVDAVNPFVIVAQANSVPHTVTPATYEMEVQTAAGVTVASLPAQASPNFSISFPASDAYRYRARGISSGGAVGSWSPWFYYWVQQVGSAQFFGENAQAVQISPLSVQAPIEIVPVSGKRAKLFAPLPAVKTENLVGSDGVTRTHYLNGVWINPSAYSGRGPHAWDSRTGRRDAIDSLNGKFDASLMPSSWPVTLDMNDTVVKAVSRPTELLSNSTQGVRYGMIDQHAGLAVVSALSTSSPLQAAPALIKHGAWSPGSISLPGYQAMADLITAMNLSTSGMSPPTSADAEAKICRFNPTGKLLRAGNWDSDDNECFIPYRTSFGSTITNYYAYDAYAVAYCMMISNAAASDVKLRLLQSEILRGLQIDFPGNDTRVGAGISQDYMVPVALSRIARGMSFLDLATTQREIAPYMYGYWDATSLGYLNPHNSLTLPTFALRRQIQTVLANNGTGHQFVVPFNVNTRTGERQQDFNKLILVRESTGEELPYIGGSGQKPGPTETFGTIGFFSTPLAVGEWVYLKIPASAMVGFVAGEPFWMYDTEGTGATMTYRWQSFNPTPAMSYRNKQDPHGGLAILHALGAYPSTPGSSWQAMKDYTLKTAQANWPAAGFDYGYTASGFVGQFFNTHAATLGITL